MRLRPADLLPGLLVAATGIGAGDLVTAALAGSELGLVVLWAVVVGAVLKYLLNEGLARWQLATDETLLRGWITRLPSGVRWGFLVYLVLWSFVVGGALVNACGVAGQALVPLGDDETGRRVWGVVHAVGGLLLVRAGGFGVFEKVMATCIAVMTACVLATAVLLQPDWGAVSRALVTPSLPEGGLSWVLGVLGGVGGTVTMLSYGHWIAEHDRRGAEGLSRCRVDLAVAYAMTAVFGLAMIVIGSGLELEGSGSGVAVALAAQLEATLGGWARLVFLVGFWGAVFSSLLGVWQGVPYLFAEAVRPADAPPADEASLRGSPAYRRYQVALALVPLPLLGVSFKGVQLAYAVCGALFMPFLAVTLLVMNTRRAWVATPFRNGRLVNLGLAVTVGFFAWTGVRALLGSLE